MYVLHASHLLIIDSSQRPVTFYWADLDYLCIRMQRLIESMDRLNLDAFIYPGWGNPPRLIGDLAQSGNTPLGLQTFLLLLIMLLRKLFSLSGFLCSR